MRKTYATGYTLIELMAVLALASALLLIAAPSFKTQILNSRLSGATTALASNIALAKAEAVGRSQWVTLCKSNADATDCTTGNWRQGWITFVDDDGNLAVDPGEQILQIQDPLDGRLTIDDPSGAVDAIRFNPNGSTSLGGTIVLVVCVDEPDWGWDQGRPRGVVVSILGKASVLSGIDSGRTGCP